jgi:multiple antibiotic resistance protein
VTPQDGLLAFGSLLFIVDPLAVIPSFLAMTASDDPRRRFSMAVRAGLTCGVVLAVFAFAGPVIFDVLGMRLSGFRVAGGLILLLVAIDMLRTQRTTQESPDELREGVEKDDIAVTPLGIPMLAGPGAISNVMVLSGRVESAADRLMVLAAVAGVSAVSIVVLALAARLQSRLGRTGIHVLTRIMGLLLAAMAMQLILDGVREALFPPGTFPPAPAPAPSATPAPAKPPG